MNNLEKEIITKAQKGALEVEDILSLAVNGDIETASFIENLRNSSNWSESEAESKRVPYWWWCVVVETYLKNSYKGLKELSKKCSPRFIIGLLEYLHTTESLEALLDTFPELIRHPSKNRELSERLIRALNLMISFPPDISTSDENIMKIRNFIHCYIDSVSSSDHMYASAICALRGVGDEKSIALIKSKNALKEEWLGTEKLVIKSIHKRLKETKQLAEK